MVSETPQVKYVTPAFSYGGFDVPSLETCSQLINNTGTGKTVRELALESVPLAWKVAFYLVGRDLSLAIGDAKCLPEPVRTVGKLVHDDARTFNAKEGCWYGRERGAFHNDALLIEPEVRIIPGKETPREEGCVAARIFQNIRDLVPKGDRLDIVPWDGEGGTTEERLWLPPAGGRFIVPVEHGAYNKFGLPDKTISDEDEAIGVWMNKGRMNKGLTREQAFGELSRFYRFRARKGLAVLYSYTDNHGGPLSVNILGDLEVKLSEVGSFAARRLAEVSEAEKPS